MQLVKLGQGKWTIYASCASDDDCPLLEFISELEEQMRAEVLADLREYLPSAEFRDWPLGFSKQLKGYDVNEFRWPKGKGGTPRVYYFFDEGKVIVCACGELKKGKNDPDALKAAEKVRAKYFKDKKEKQLKYRDYDEFLDCSESNT
jgi:hypothetical protein